MKRLSLLLFLCLFSFSIRVSAGVCRRNRPYAAPAGKLQPAPAARCPAPSSTLLRLHPGAHGISGFRRAARTRQRHGGRTGGGNLCGRATASLRNLSCRGQRRVSAAGDAAAAKIYRASAIDICEVRHRRRKNYLDLRQGVRGPLSRANPFLRSIARDQC